MLTFTFAHRYPVVAGVKTTLTVQEALAATVEQLFVCENWLDALPVSVMLLTGSGALPVFVTVSVLAALEVPTATLPNETEVGESVKGSLPVPFTVAEWVTPEATTFSVARV